MKSKSSTVHFSRPLASALLPLLVLLVAACDSGSSSGGGPPMAPRTFSYTYTPDSAAPNNSVSIQVVADGDGIRFRVAGTGLVNLHSYDYEVSLPPLVRFTTGQADFGDFLTGSSGAGGGADDDSFSFQSSLSPDQPGRSGDGSLGSAGRYALRAAGSGRVEFSRALFRDADERPLPGLTLVGGTLQVTEN
jgi:hypothetical protein